VVLVHTTGSNLYKVLYPQAMYVIGME
jgi:hypothetical protein